MAVLGLSCGMWDLPVSWGLFHYGTRILYLQCKGSVVAAHRLSCSAACGILVPWPGIKPMSSALQGWFLTIGPSGKSLDSILKSRDITLPTKVCLVKAMHFSSSHVWLWELDCNESWVPKNWCFWTVVLEKTLESLGLQEDPTSPS